MRRHTFDLLVPRPKPPGRKLQARTQATELNEEAERYLRAWIDCYRMILGRIATALVAKLSAELDEVLADYAAFKRSAAMLDFDDLAGAGLRAGA